MWRLLVMRPVPISLVYSVSSPDPKTTGHISQMLWPCCCRHLHRSRILHMRTLFDGPGDVLTTADSNSGHSHPSTFQCLQPFEMHVVEYRTWTVLLQLPGCSS